MRPAQGHNILIIKTHAIENVAEVSSALRGVRQTAIGDSLGAVVGVRAARPPGDHGPTGLFHRLFWVCEKVCISLVFPN